jgi:predicted Rossmann-fold nucleotide-binding protein
MQTHKITMFPVVLVGREYWSGLLDWLRGAVLDRGLIHEGDLDLLRVVDTADEVIDVLRDVARGR